MKNDSDLKMIIEQTSDSYAGEGGDERSSRYQSEDELEKELIKILGSQGYEYRDDIKSEEAMRDNLREKLEKLNKGKIPNGFSDSEWTRFFEEVVANKSDGLLEKTKKLRQSHLFRLDSGEEKNLILISPDPTINSYQVVNQIERNEGKRKNRYDVTILVNGLPLIHVELKRRGVALQEAFNQVNRYRRDSFWSETGLFNYVQIFVISNGTLTRYYSNTTKELSRINQAGNLVAQKKTFAYEFTSSWTDKDNKPINDLPSFARSFFEYRRLGSIIYRYSVLGTDDVMRVLRPYQIYAVEAIEARVNSSKDKAGTVKGGGYIWHTTGSGKTLTSFVTATLLTERDDIDKVLFVVDRKDLDYQTMLEFNKFSEGSVDGTNNTNHLKRQLHSKDDKIIVTTIQKLDRYVKKNKDASLRSDRVVIIFDECHRSQFGVFQQNITRFFKNYHLFGFTGTPIFAKNANKSVTLSTDKVSTDKSVAQIGTTEAVFGDQLHTYTIVNAINDKNVLPFKVDYVNTVKEKDNIKNKKVPAINTREVLGSPERVEEVVKYIIENHDAKTRNRHFNAILATPSVEMAEKYYREFKKQQAALTNPESPRFDPDFKPLRVATIFSYQQNDDDGSTIGDINSIDDESLEDTSGLSTSARDQLDEAIKDYNLMFKTNFDSGSGFPDYYKDLSSRMKSYRRRGEDLPFLIDVLIVVNMFLTGFDAVTLNTLYVDKNLRLHGLLQAFSRTNRILNSEKSHGEIICFRNLKEEVDESISLFGDKGAAGIVLLKPYSEYLSDYKNLIEKLEKLTPPEDLVKESEKKEFVEVWSSILKTDNILKTFDQYESEDLKLSERVIQDMNSYYLELRDTFTNDEKGESVLGDVVFETELVRSIEVNIDYILTLIEKYKDSNSTDEKVREAIKKSIDSSPTLRDKKELLDRFIAAVSSEEDVNKQFERFVDKEAKRELEEIAEDYQLNFSKTKKLINRALKNKELSNEGTEIINLNNGGKIGFGVARNQWKENVAGALVDFFERYNDLINRV